MSEVVCETAGADRILCTTCRLGGLIRCPSLGTPLPLVEGEKPKVIYSRGVFLTPVQYVTWSKKLDPRSW